MTEIKETWWRIRGYHGLYEVSNLGNIRSIKNGRKRVKKLILTYANNKEDKSSKYYSVNLWKDGSQKGYLVHRLVAMTFIANLDKNKNIVDHINNDTLDNRVENLRWTTKSKKEL